MNIAYILLDPGIGVFGTKGASVHVQEVIRALRSLGHKVTVFCTRIDDDIPADLSDLDIRRYALPKGLDTASREQALLETSDRIAADVAGEDFDMVYERYSLFSTAGARAKAPTFIVEANSPLVEEQSTHRSLHDAKSANAATTETFQAADVISCVSPSVAQWAAGEVKDAKKVITVPNGVNVDRIVPAAKRPQEKELVVGFVGTLKPWHGTHTLIEALGLMRHPARVEIVGKGPELENLQRQAADQEVEERVIFHGAIAPSEMPVYLQRFDVATAPYPAGDHYFSPLKIYEYLAAGLPVVASANGVIPEIVDSSMGMLIEPGDAATLAQALDELAADPQRRQLLGKAAREAALREHSWLSRVKAILAKAGHGS